MSKQRLDTLLVERGLVASRERARALILAGQVLVGGRPGGKAGEMVTDDADVSLVVPDHPYVGRGGLKLAHAIDTFQIAVTGRTGLDIGASTGGFTDVLLQNGAAHVVALDVGHGQLDWKIRSDARVTVMERVNARTLTPEMFRDADGAVAAVRHRDDRRILHLAAADPAGRPAAAGAGCRCDRAGEAAVRGGTAGSRAKAASCATRRCISGCSRK